jgi:hypothetical protein
VGGVGHEVTLGLEGSFESTEEIVEGLAKLCEFVVGTGESESSVKVRGRNLLGRSGDSPEWAEDPAGEPPGAR